MQYIEFLSLFGECIGADIKDRFASASITDIQASLEERTIDVTVRFDSYISDWLAEKVKAQITQFMSLNALNFEYFYGEEMFCDKWIPYLVKDIERKFSAGKTFLEDALYEIDNNNLKITLKRNGKNILTQLGVEAYIAKTVMQRFNTSVKVDIISSLPNGSEDEAKALQALHKQEAAKVKAPVEAKKNSEEKKKKPAVKTYDDLPISLTNAKIVFGTAIKDKPVPINEITPEDGTVVIWGDVFSFDARETRDGKKNIISFNLTDYTSSYTAKIFGEKQVCKEVIEKVKDGTTVMIRGFVNFDPYMKCYIIETKAVTVIEKLSKTDDAPEKRVELHLHTNMSAMDAVSSAKDLVSQAAKWGHKAIAITDHGNVQAFPEAMNTAEKAGIKIIYGIEAYFVDDMAEAGSDPRSLKYYHQIILVKNNVGLKNLYKLITASNLEFFKKKPRIPKSRLIQHREGLIIGSACEAGDLYRAIVSGESEEKIMEIAKFYDYLEIQPNGNNMFMVRSPRDEYAHIKSVADLENIIR